MKHLTDANKDKLLGFLRSRAAAGEASLKSWGRDQRPQIPGVLVEEIADALVSDGLVVKETRSHGGYVWRAAIEPASDEVEKEEAPPSAEEEEPVAVAGSVEPCQRCAELEEDMARMEQAMTGARSEIAILRKERDEARHNFVTSAAEYDRLLSHLRDRLAIEETASVDYIVGAVGLLVDGASRRAEAPIVDEDARIRDYLLALPEHRWQRLGAARAKIAKARQAVLDAQAAESKLLDEIAGVNKQKRAAKGKAKP